MVGGGGEKEEKHELVRVIVIKKKKESHASLYTLTTQCRRVDLGPTTGTGFYTTEDTDTGRTLATVTDVFTVMTTDTLLQFFPAQLITLMTRG